MRVEADSHKLVYHPERVAEWRKRGDCFPIYVEIGATNRCNHRCCFCALDWIEHGGFDIKSDVLCRNLEDMASHGVKSVMFAGEGEPFLYKNMELIVKTAKTSGLDVAINSNGILFKKTVAEKILPYLSWIRFSVDAGTAETYAKLHGCKKKEFEIVIENIRDAAEIKRKNNYPVTIGTQAVLINLNSEELCTLAEIIKKTGADNFQIKPYSRHPASKNDFSFDYRSTENLKERIEAIGDENFQVVYRSETIKRLNSALNYDKCHGISFFALIDSKGNVIPCNLYYHNPEYIYGNIYENLFSEIWNSEKRRKIVETLKGEGVSKCRLGCRLDVINRYLHRLKNPHPHDNFI